MDKSDNDIFSVDQDDSAFSEHKYKYIDLHNPIIKAIWNVDRFNPKKDDKLKELRNLLHDFNSNILCDIFHDVKGEPIAQASPLIIACFEGYKFINIFEILSA